MNVLSREQARLLLSQAYIGCMSPDERKMEIESWWGLDDEDPEWGYLPAGLQEEMASADEPIGDILSVRYEPLLHLGFSYKMRGVRNEWISHKLAEMDLGEFVVEGSVEYLSRCPCCGFRTLETRGEYFICPVCFWEDDGTSDPDQYSGPNHKTLADGQNNFQAFGVSDERSSNFVVANPEIMYLT